MIGAREHSKVQALLSDLLRFDLPLLGHAAQLLRGSTDRVEHRRNDHEQTPPLPLRHRPPGRVRPAAGARRTGSACRLCARDRRLADLGRRADDAGVGGSPSRDPFRGRSRHPAGPLSGRPDSRFSRKRAEFRSSSAPRICATCLAISARPTAQSQGYGAYDIEILAEINHVPRLSATS